MPGVRATEPRRLPAKSFGPENPDDWGCKTQGPVLNENLNPFDQEATKN